MSDNKEKKIDYNFDAFLMYLIQDVSKKPSAEIVTFFHELATQVADVSFAAKKDGGGIDKRIFDYFPGTSVPFYMRLKGRRRSQEWNSKTRQYEEVNYYSCDAEITFPQEMTRMKQDTLDQVALEIMENRLLGADMPNMPNFERPEIRTPKVLKDLMDAFAGRPVQEKKTRKKKQEEPKNAS